MSAAAAVSSAWLAGCLLYLQTLIHKSLYHDHTCRNVSKCEEMPIGGNVDPSFEDKTVVHVADCAVNRSFHRTIACHITGKSAYFFCACFLITFNKNESLKYNQKAVKSKLSQLETLAVQGNRAVLSWIRFTLLPPLLQSLQRWHNSHTDQNNHPRVSGCWF